MVPVLKYQPLILLVGRVVADDVSCWLQQKYLSPGRVVRLQVVLSREDQAMYEGWEYHSVDYFQQEVVDFLTFRDSNTAGFDTHGGGCCSIS